MQQRRRLASVVAAGLATGLVMAACTTGDGDGDEAEAAVIQECVDDPNNCLGGATQEGGSITWMIPQPGSGWNLINPASGSVYGLQLMTGILATTGWTGPDGEYVFNLDLLAEEPQLINEDPWTYQLVIAEDAVWSNGEPITGDDFLLTWYMTKGDAGGNCTECVSRSAESANNIESVEVSEDGKTVTYTLLEGLRNVEWFSEVGTGSAESTLYPAYLAEEQGLDWRDPDDLAEYYQYLDTTVPEWSGGPYQIVEGSLEEGVVMERNPNYYGDPAPLDTVVMRVLIDNSTWVDAFANGEIDGGSPPDISQDVVEQLLARDDVLVHASDGLSWEHVDLNLENPQLQELELRRAMFTAIDRGDIADRNYGRVYPDFSVRNSYSSWLDDSPFFVDHITPTGFGTGNVEEARSILEAAGYEGFDGEAGSLALNGQQIGPFRLRTTESPARSTSVTLIQEQLAQIGIQADIEFTEDLGGTLGEADYDIMQFGWSGSPAFFITDPSTIGHSEQGSNFGSFSDPNYDQFAEATIAAGTVEEAAQNANDAYAIVAPAAYVLPLYWTPTTFFIRADTYANVRDNTRENNRALNTVGGWGLLAEE